MKKALRYLVVSLALIALMAPAFLAQAASYPTKEVRMIVPWNPGGANDIMARNLQPILEKAGFKMVIENVPGGASAVGMGQVATSDPDGYTLGWGSSSILAVIAEGQVPLSTDDFTYIARASEDPVLLLVHKDDPRNTVKKFMDYVKAHPGEVTVAAPGARTINDLLTVMAAESIGASIRSVPFTGGSRCAAELLGRQVDAAAIKPSESAQLRESGDIIPLGFVTKYKSPGMEHLPTFIEEGYNTYLHGPLIQMAFIIGPKDMPKDVTDYLIKTFGDAFATPEWQAVAKREGFMSEPLTGEPLKAMAVDVKDALNVVLKAIPVQ